MKVIIFGKGNMGQAIGKNFELAGNQVVYFGNGDKAEKLGDLPTTVLLAGDDQEAKATIKEALAGSPLRVLDAGALKRARELEATGFLQMTLAASEQIAWTGGFGIVE